MPGLTSGLYIGLSGLQASQGALNVVGHNISNVNTPYYSRQRVNLGANLAQTFGTLQYGTGVSLTSIYGVRNKYLDMQITQTNSKQSGAETRYQGISGIASAFQDDGTSGLSTLVQNYFTAFQQLAARPEDGSVRTNVVGQAQSLVNGLKTRYKLLQDQQAQANQGIDSTVTQINQLTTQIAALNARVAAEPSPGSDSDARDQRQALANQLAGLVGVQVFEDSHDQLQISLDTGAAVLVAGQQSFTMSATPDPANNNFSKVEVTMGGTTVDVTKAVKEGALGASLDLRDNVIAGYEAKLDELAAGISGQTNLLQRAGFDKSGTAVAGTAWEDIFLGTTTNGADGLPSTVSAANNYKGMVNSLSVNAAIVSDPSRIAAANVAGSSGNNGNALAIAKLQTTASTVDTDGDGTGDSGPFSTVITSLVNQIGNDGQGYQTTSTTQENLMSALQTQRSQVSGVDLDEEATSLISFQRGYQAAARFVSVIDQLTAQLIQNLSS